MPLNRTLLETRAIKVLAVAQAIAAAGITPPETGKRMVGYARAAKLAASADEPALAGAALGSLLIIAYELADTPDENDGPSMVAGAALRRRVDLAVGALGK